MNTFYRNLLFLLLPLVYFGCNGAKNTSDIDTNAIANERVLSILKETRTTQYFSGESVPLEDITIIMDAGRNASSGRNMQPWYFVAILNQEVIKEIASTMLKSGPPHSLSGTQPKETPTTPPTSPKYPKARLADAPAAIIMACEGNNDFATGLACENMVIAATALGYGTKIVGGGVNNLNESENKALLQLPDAMRVVKILIVGKADSTVDMTVDGVTGASIRKPLNEISTVIR